MFYLLCFIHWFKNIRNRSVDVICSAKFLKLAIASSFSSFCRFENDRNRSIKLFWQILKIEDYFVIFYWTIYIFSMQCIQILAIICRSKGCCFIFSIYGNILVQMILALKIIQILCTKTGLTGSNKILP